MTNYDVVKKLIGAIEPVGETNTDNKRFENLTELCDLMYQMHLDIQDVAYRYRSSQEYSVKKSCDFANKFLNELGK